jgi:hypothetical protein
MAQTKGGREAESSSGPWRREPDSYVTRALARTDWFWVVRETGDLPARGCLVEVYGEVANRTQVKRLLGVRLRGRAGPRRQGPVSVGQRAYRLRFDTKLCVLTRGDLSASAAG